MVSIDQATVRPFPCMDFHAAPRIMLRQGRQTSLYRIQMDVSAYLKEIRILFHQHAPVPALEQVAGCTVFYVILLGVVCI